MLYAYYLNYSIDTGARIDLIKNIIVSSTKVTREEAKKLVETTLKYNEVLGTFSYAPIIANEPRLVF